MRRRQFLGIIGWNDRTACNYFFNYFYFFGGHYGPYNNAVIDETTRVTHESRTLTGTIR